MSTCTINSHVHLLGLAHARPWGGDKESEEEVTETTSWAGVTILVTVGQRLDSEGKERKRGVFDARRGGPAHWTGMMMSAGRRLRERGDSIVRRIDAEEEWVQLHLVFVINQTRARPVVACALSPSEDANRGRALTLSHVVSINAGEVETVTHLVRVHTRS